MKEYNDYWMLVKHLIYDIYHSTVDSCGHMTHSAGFQRSRHVVLNIVILLEAKLGDHHHEPVDNYCQTSVLIYAYWCDHHKHI